MHLEESDKSDNPFFPLHAVIVGTAHFSSTVLSNAFFFIHS